jgi:hypothetical protein
MTASRTTIHHYQFQLLLWKCVTCMWKGGARCSAAVDWYVAETCVSKDTRNIKPCDTCVHIRSAGRVAAVVGGWVLLLACGAVWAASRFAASCLEAVCVDFNMP